AYQYYLMARGYLQDFSAHPEHVDNALQVLNEALKLDPNFGLAMATRGGAYWAKYGIDKRKKWAHLAQQQCTRAVELANSGSAGHMCLGIIYYGTGQYLQAITELQRAIELEPANEEPYWRLARTYAKVNKLDDAEKTYQRLITLRPRYYQGYNVLGIFY